MRSGVRDQPGQHGETPSLLKIQKLAKHSGACLWSRSQKQNKTPENSSAWLEYGRIWEAMFQNGVGNKLKSARLGDLNIFQSKKLLTDF